MPVMNVMATPNSASSHAQRFRVNRPKATQFLAGQDARLLGLKLGLGQDAGVAQRAQLL